MRFKGVFFDLYGTLLVLDDHAAAWADWFCALSTSLSRSGLSISPSDLAVQCEGLFEKHAPTPEDGVLSLYERRIKALFLRLGAAPEAAAIRRAAADSLQAWNNHASLDPEAVPLLESLRSACNLALISNFDHPAHIYAVLEKLELARFFPVVVVSGAVGARKPDPRIFLPALEATSLGPREVAYLGDAPEDVRAATAAGIYPVLIRRPSAPSVECGRDFRSDTGAERPSQEDPQFPGVTRISSLSQLRECLG